jgi:hypothetical protein
MLPAAPGVLGLMCELREQCKRTAGSHQPHFCGSTARACWGISLSCATTLAERWHRGSALQLLDASDVAAPAKRSSICVSTALLQVGMERYIWPLPARNCGLSWEFMCHAFLMPAGRSSGSIPGKLHLSCFSLANRQYSV